MYTDLLEEIQQNPTDIDATVAKRRKEFTGEFFRHINTLSETRESLEDRDGNQSCYLYLIRAFFFSQTCGWKKGRSRAPVQLQ